MTESFITSLASSPRPSYQPSHASISRNAMPTVLIPPINSRQQLFDEATGTENIFTVTSHQPIKSPWPMPPFHLTISFDAPTLTTNNEEKSNLKKHSPKNHSNSNHNPAASSRSSSPLNHAAVASLDSSLSNYYPPRTSSSSYLPNFSRGSKNTRTPQSNQRRSIIETSYSSMERISHLIEKDKESSGAIYNNPTEKTNNRSEKHKQTITTVPVTKKKPNNTVPYGFHYARQFDAMAAASAFERKTNSESECSDEDFSDSDSESEDEYEKRRNERLEAERQQQIKNREAQNQQLKTIFGDTEKICIGSEEDDEIDTWWEMKRQHEDHDVTTRLKNNETLTDRSTHPDNEKSQELQDSKAYGQSDDPSQRQLTYNSITPNWLSERADFNSFLQTCEEQLCINTLEKNSDQRSSFETKRLLKWLEKIPPFNGLPYEIRYSLLGESTLAHVPMNGTIYNAGEIGGCFYVILSGTVQTFIGKTTENHMSSTLKLDKPSVTKSSTDLLRPGQKPFSLALSKPSLNRAFSRSPRESMIQQLALLNTLNVGAMFGQRHSEAETPTAHITNKTVKHRTHAQLLWSKLKESLEFSKSFNVANIMKVASTHTRLETAKALTNCTILSILYNEFDRILRQYEDRQRRTTVALFRSIPICSRMRSKHLANLSKAVQHQTFKPNQVIYNQGENTNTLFFLQQGTIEILKSVQIVTYARIPTGKHSWEIKRNTHEEQFFVSKRTAPCFFGEEALLGCFANDCSVRASEVCEVYRLERTKFHLMMQPMTMKFMHKSVESFRERAVERICQNAEEAEQRIIDQGKKHKSCKRHVNEIKIYWKRDVFSIVRPNGAQDLSEASPNDTLSIRLMERNQIFDKSLLIDLQIPFSPLLFTYSK